MAVKPVKMNLWAALVVALVFAIVFTLWMNRTTDLLIKDNACGTRCTYIGHQVYPRRDAVSYACSCSKRDLVSSITPIKIDHKKGIIMQLGPTQRYPIDLDNLYWESPRPYRQKVHRTWDHTPAWHLADKKGYSGQSN